MEWEDREKRRGEDKKEKGKHGEGREYGGNERRRKGWDGRENWKML